MKAIADTGFLVAFANRHDEHHGWAVEVAASLSSPALTCEPVLAEAAYHLRNSKLILAMVKDGLVQEAFDCTENISELALLADNYANRKPDLADLCLIKMSELHPDHVVLTVDRADFAVYRKNRRERIPILCPPLA